MSKVRAILIVDDEFIILESLRIQLERILDETILIEAASSGEEAFALIDEFHESDVDLVMAISDFNLDDTKGTVVLAYVHEKFPDTKKGLLSGQSEIQQVEECEQKIGLHARFPKPWEFEEIKQSIQQVFYPTKKE
ncbi:MAG: response regulator [Bacteroidota bacterium]